MPMYSSLTEVELKLTFSNKHTFELAYREVDPDYGDACYDDLQFTEYDENEEVVRSSELFLEHAPFDDSVISALESEDIYLEDAFEIGCRSIMLSQIVGAKSRQEIISTISDSIRLYLPNKEDFAEMESGEAVYEVMDALDQWNADFSNIKEDIEQSIVNNMESIEDIIEASWELQDQTTYRFMGDWKADDLFAKIFDYDLRSDIVDVFDNIERDTDEQIIAKLKEIDALEMYSEDTFDLLVDYYLSDPQQEAADFAIMQTWKKGEKIDLDIDLFKENQFGLD